MLIKAILVGLVLGLCKSEWIYGFPQVGRPIVVSTLTGLFLGDPVQGVIMGSVLELMFIGSFPIGAAVSPDYTSAGAICTAFAILTGGGKAVATAMALPIALLGGFIFIGCKLMNAAFGQIMMKYLEKDDSKGASRIYIMGSVFTCFVVYFAYAFVCIFAGSAAVEAAVNAIPKVIINNDNDLLHDWYEKNKDKIEIHTVGIENNSELMAKSIELGEESSEFKAIAEKKETEIQVPVAGTHFVYNALCAMEVGIILGISTNQIQNGIAKFELTKKRMDIRKLENGAIIINDAYNASYESMRASIEFLANHTGTRKIAVLGDMFELGEYSEELHRNVGKEVASHDIDVLICAGENSKYIIEEAQKNKKIETFYFHNNEEIVEKLTQELREGDIVLVKASNGMKFFEICQKL